MINSNKNIALNTLILYFRMLFLMAVSLYTSRVVLNTLGVEDYGIYNIVGGVVTLFSFLNGTLATATQRFFSFAIGKNDIKELSKLFSITITIHLILASIILIIAEILGLYIINYKLNIPEARIYAANWVFQCSIISFFFSIISVPYNALIISKEKMQAFAYISILEAGLKLAAVYLLKLFIIDKLILYSILILFIAIIIRSIYNIYCNIKFKECHYKFIIDKNIYRKILSFSGWNLIGALAIILKEQGVNILLNIFCGVTVNSARAITSQVNNAINSFISNFQIALNPQITKAYSSNNQEYLNLLIIKGSKYSALLFYIIGLPFFLDTHNILNIWLGHVPNYTVIFLKLIIVQTLIESLSNPLITALLATGKVKTYQLMVGGILILNLPLSFVMLKLGYSPYFTIVIAIILASISLYVRLSLLSQIIIFPIGKYFKSVILKVFIVIFSSIPIPLFIHLKTLNYNGIIHLILIVSICIICSGISIFYLGLDKTEKLFIIKKINNIRTNRIHEK